MKFILTRHCETDWNKQGLLQGWTDIGINEAGWVQAEELAKNLAQLKFKFNKVVSSDLKRSVETASVLSSYLKIPVLQDRRLRECGFGEFEGKPREKVSEKYSEVSYDFEPFGGESRDQVLRRHLALLDDLSFDQGEEKDQNYTLLVGHGTGLNTVLHHLKKGPLLRGEYALIDYPV
ncbi:histidine phosphatase family protein [Candidatus Giovannonibacteria bacterium]|nr:histidine phosphatase family protein [Candidatus Giovannonibacteria bacterium]